MNKELDVVLLRQCHIQFDSYIFMLFMNFQNELISIFVWRFFAYRFNCCFEIELYDFSSAVVEYNNNNKNRFTKLIDSVCIFSRTNLLNFNWKMKQRGIVSKPSFSRVSLDLRRPHNGSRLRPADQPVNASNVEMSLAPLPLEFNGFSASKWSPFEWQIAPIIMLLRLLRHLTNQFDAMRIFANYVESLDEK